jgi:hypothetical protein
MRGEVRFVLADCLWFATGDTLGASEVANWLAVEAEYSSNAIQWYEKQIINYDVKITNTNFIGSGNAHHIFSTGDYVFLLCEYVDDQKVLLTKDACLSALRSYRAFLDSDYKNPEIQPEPFEVEYIAEGEEALSEFIGLGGILKAELHPE